jgi:preprotein translocase subunit SecF
LTQNAIKEESKVKKEIGTRRFKMKRNWWFVLGFMFIVIFISGCAQIEVGIKVDSNATIPKARISISTTDVNVYSQIKKAAVNEYKKLPEDERSYVEIQAKEDASPYIIAWVWSFPNQEKAQQFTEQFLGSTAKLSKDQDLVILEATLNGEELGDALDKMGAGTVKPLLGNVTLALKAYMPGEVISYVDGKVDQNTWTLEMNVGKVYKEKPTYDIEVISRDK